MRGVAISMLALCLSVGAVAAQNNSYVVEATRLLNKIDANPQRVLLVDVRSAYEFEKGSLPGAVHLDAAAPDFVERMKALITPQIGMVALVCLTGHKSAQAAETLRAAGVGEVYSMKGGLRALARTGQSAVAYLAPQPDNGGMTREEFTNLIYSAPNVLFHFSAKGDAQHDARVAEYEELNARFQGRLNIVTIDVYEHPFITSKFAYDRLPYYMWFTANGMQWEHNGPLTQEAILNSLSQ